MPAARRAARDLQPARAARNAADARAALSPRERGAGVTAPLSPVAPCRAVLRRCAVSTGSRVRAQ
ncbi:hypothetical protein BLAT2472_40162 [Burkholderia latens]